MFHSLACHLTTSLDHSPIFRPEDKQSSITSAYIWGVPRMCGYVRALGSVRAPLLCLLVHSITLHLLKWAALPGAPLRSEACSHASIYRLPRIRAMLRRPLPCGSGEVTPTETGFRWGGRVSSPGHRLGALWDLKVLKKFVQTKLKRHFFTSSLSGF